MTKLPDRIWILSEDCMEYNDQYYYQTEGGGGIPKNIFLTKEEADAARLKEEIRACRHMECIGAYGEDIEYMCDSPAEEAAIQMAQIFGKPLKSYDPDSWYDWTVPEDATDEQIVEFMDLFNTFSFYSVFSVPTPEWLRTLVECETKMVL